jgi:hypothetical protein
MSLTCGRVRSSQKLPENFIPKEQKVYNSPWLTKGALGTSTSSYVLATVVWCDHCKLLIVCGIKER